MKNRNIFRHTKFSLCCVLFTFICVFGSAAAFADDTQLMDRNGAALSGENFLYYDAALESFNENLKAGDSVKLSIDLALQEMAGTALADALAGYENAAGCAVVLDIKTGAPLLLISSGTGADPLNSTFAPHQLLTPATALAALNEGLVEMDTFIPCEGVFTRYEDDGVAPQCWIWSAAEPQHLTHPEENVTTALRDNCQYYFYCLGNDLGIDALTDYVRTLGLGEPSGIELPSSNGVLASRDTKPAGQAWNIGDTLEAAVGRSVNAFTPLQLARYCAAIANNGLCSPCSIVYEITDLSGNVQVQSCTAEISGQREMTEEKWKAVKEGLYLKLNDALNTGEQPMPASGLEMAGAGCYVLQDGYALFMGYAPYDKPQYAIALAITDIDSLSPAQTAAYEIMSLLT